MTIQAVLCFFLWHVVISRISRSCLVHTALFIQLFFVCGSTPCQPNFYWYLPHSFQGSDLSRKPPETRENGSGSWKERGLKRMDQESPPRQMHRSAQKDGPNLRGCRPVGQSFGKNLNPSQRLLGLSMDPTPPLDTPRAPVVGTRSQNQVVGRPQINRIGASGLEQGCGEWNPLL